MAQTEELTEFTPVTAAAQAHELVWRNFVPCIRGAAPASGLLLLLWISTLLARRAVHKNSDYGT